MFIRGQLHGITIETEHAWASDGRLETTSMRLRGLQRLELEGCEDGGLREEDLQQRPKDEHCDLLLTATGARSLRGAGDEMELVLGPTLEPDALEERLPALLRIAQSRADPLGPYR